MYHLTQQTLLGIHSTNICILLGVLLVIAKDWEYPKYQSRLDCTLEITMILYDL